MKVDNSNLLTKLAGIVGVTSVSLLIGLPTGANEVLNPNPSIFNEATYNRSQRILANTQHTLSKPALKAAKTKTLGKNTVAQGNTGSGTLNPSPSILQECPYNRAACPPSTGSPELPSTSPEGTITPPDSGTGLPTNAPAPGSNTNTNAPDPDAPRESPTAPQPGPGAPATPPRPRTGAPGTAPAPGSNTNAPDPDAPRESPTAPQPGPGAPSTPPGTRSPSQSAPGTRPGVNPSAPGSGIPATTPSSGRNDRRNLVAVAEANGSFTVLTRALRVAGLTETLQGAGPYTIFAPTDAAFAKLPQDAVQDLLKPENKEVLVKILRYHVVQGSVLSNNLKSGEVKSIEGGPISVRVDRKTGVTVNDAKVVTPDIKASNGVIHIIDNVILPPDL